MIRPLIVIVLSAMLGQTYPSPGPGRNASYVAPTVIILTSGTSWTVPSNWNSSNNSIEVIGGGGGHNQFSGGGAAYAKITNLTLTPGNSVSYQVAVPQSGFSGITGQDTWFNGTGATCASQSVCAKGGAGNGYGAGGSAASSIGSTTYSGGNGASYPTVYGGGGGAAGPHGAGLNGQNVANGSGGAGDNGFGGAGGAGGGANNGGNGTEWTTAGSGGGGAGYNNANLQGYGGNYGGGSGSGAYNLGVSYSTGGVIVITYKP